MEPASLASTSSRGNYRLNGTQQNPGHYGAFSYIGGNRLKASSVFVGICHVRVPKVCDRESRFDIAEMEAAYRLLGKTDSMPAG